MHFQCAFHQEKNVLPGSRRKPNAKKTLCFMGESPRKGVKSMNESIFKKIWNYSITVGQMIMTALAMAIVSLVVWLLFSAFRPSKD